VESNQRRFIRFQNIVFTRLVTDDRTDDRTDGQTIWELNASICMSVWPGGRINIVSKKHDTDYNYVISRA